jgi:hypothetical protein
MSHLSVQTKLDSFFKFELLRSKTSTTSEFISKGSTEILFHLFSSALLISLNFSFICVRRLCLLGLPYVFLIRVTSPQITPDVI